MARGSPPANQKGGKCEAQHLWLSLAKLANLAGGGDGGLNASSDPVTVDLVRGGEIQRRLELAEVRERLIESLPANEVSGLEGVSRARGGGLLITVHAEVVMDY